MHVVIVGVVIVGVDRYPKFFKPYYSFKPKFIFDRFDKMVTNDTHEGAYCVSCMNHKFYNKKRKIKNGKKD